MPGPHRSQAHRCRAKIRRRPLLGGNAGASSKPSPPVPSEDTSPPSPWRECRGLIEAIEAQETCTAPIRTLPGGNAGASSKQRGVGRHVVAISVVSLAGMPGPHRSASPWQRSRTPILLSLARMPGPHRRRHCFAPAVTAFLLSLARMPGPHRSSKPELARSRWLSTLPSENAGASSKLPICRGRLPSPAALPGENAGGSSKQAVDDGGVVVGATLPSENAGASSKRAHHRGGSCAPVLSLAKMPGPHRSMEILLLMVSAKHLSLAKMPGPHRRTRPLVTH